ncbi:hypothetical protein DERF_014283 [Dermatophagoides farinae]|uniref:Uncharacterized protein n=1 Tax=Dermatophagoides farinae TaxID=6954 RepID=A0A922L152_DERFA|nr:hypothetical protein DERF_014283 [Dermatophagoides farinae]
MDVNIRMKPFQMIRVMHYTVHQVTVQIQLNYQNRATFMISVSRYNQIIKPFRMELQTLLWLSFSFR